MALIELFWTSAAAGRWRFILLAFLSAASNAAVIMLVSTGAQAQGTGADGLRQVTLFGLAIAIFILSQQRLLNEVSGRIEALIRDVRLDLLRRARSAEALQIDAVGRAELYGAISRATQTISQITPSLVIALQSIILLSLSSLYILWLSRLAFCVWTATITATIVFHLFRSRRGQRILASVAECEGGLLQRFSDLFEGFREFRISSAKMDDVAREISAAATDAAARKVDFHRLFAVDFTLSTSCFYALAGLMAFVVPRAVGADSHTAMSLTTTSLFMLGPVGNIAYSLSMLQQANAAASEISTLSTRLGDPEAVGSDPDAADRFPAFRRLELRALSFRYRGAAADREFAFGPVDLAIERGEVLFITGGNGSGKTTLISLLLDLYPPTSGGIWLDGVQITGRNRAAYRDLFAVVLSGHHLFSRIYGLRPGVDREAAELIELLELTSKVKMESGGFSTTKLSSGQRKRLTLIAAMLEHKPVYVFDEWAADQDPHFRAKFYDEILPRLKAQGSTVIAITHDEKYFDRADRRIHVEDGRLHPHA